jgi:hypothetical protein
MVNFVLHATALLGRVYCAYLFVLFYENRIEYFVSVSHSPSMHSCLFYFMKTELNILFQYHTPRRCTDGCEYSPYSLSPVGSKSQKLLRSPRKVRVLSSSWECCKPNNDTMHNSYSSTKHRIVEWQLVRKTLTQCIFTWCQVVYFFFLANMKWRAWTVGDTTFERPHLSAAHLSAATFKRRTLQRSTLQRRTF